MRNGTVFPRQSSAPLTSGTGYGYWPDSIAYIPDRLQLEDTVRKLLRGETARLPTKRFEFLPTPTRSDARNKGSPSMLLRKYIPLSCRVRILEDGWFDASGGRTNPEFVEWLMAWPIAWTDLKPLATDRLHTWLLGLSPFSLRDSDRE
jgi:hypothetical protein